MAAVVWLLLGLAVSVGVAQLMYNAIELPAIRLSHRFKPSRVAKATGETATPAEQLPRAIGGQLSPGLAS